MLNFNDHVFPFSTRESSRKDSRFGIEVEVENCPYEYGSDFWHSTADTSLKIHGIEYVSAILQKKEVPEALTELYSKVKYLANKSATFTPRTSIHIHSDGKWMKQQNDIIPVIFFYLLVEDLMYQFVEPHRRKNIFCVKTKESHYLRRHFLNQHLNLDGMFKYAGFNLRSLREHGTVEFRMLEGTYDIPKILQWVEFIDSIQKYAKDTDIENGLSFRKEVKNPERARSVIYPLFSKHFSDQQIENSIQSGLNYFRFLVCPTLSQELKEAMFNPEFFKSKFYIRNFVRLDK